MKINIREIAEKYGKPLYKDDVEYAFYVILAKVPRRKRARLQKEIDLVAERLR